MLRLVIVIFLFICGCDSSQYDNQAIRAAKVTRHSIDIRSVPNTISERKTTDVEVNGKQSSFVFILKSASSPINVIHQHSSAKVPPIQKSSSVDKPHIMTHSVNKPIIQEIRELINPYRRRIQEIRPVQEEIHTVVARGEPRNGGSGGGYGGGPNVVTTGAGYGGGVQISSVLTQDKQTILNSKKVIPIDKVAQLGQPKYQLFQRRKPLIKTSATEDSPSMSNMIDHSLYSGTSEYDLKYISPNIESLDKLVNNKNYLAYKMLRVYKDRK